MMKRIYSLKGSKSFKTLIEKGKRIEREGIQLIMLKSQDDQGLIAGPAEKKVKPDVRIGVTLNSKFGNAVTRNKAKRRLRAICGELLPEMEEGYRLILRPRSEFINADHAKAVNTIRALLRRAGVIRR